MSALINIWPEDVGYDRLCGYKAERYDAQKDEIQRVTLLVNSWKQTALEHRFSSENVRALSCEPSDDGHQLTFLDPSSKSVTLKCQVQTVAVSADVDADPEDTCVEIEIIGRNFVTAENFRYYLSVYRHPEVLAHTLYKNSAPLSAVEDEKKKA